MWCFTYHRRCPRMSFGGSSWCPRRRRVLRRHFRLPIAAETRCGWRRIVPGYLQPILEFRPRLSAGSGTDYLRRGRRATSAVPDWSVLLTALLHPDFKNRSQMFIYDPFIFVDVFQNRNRYHGAFVHCRWRQGGTATFFRRCGPTAAHRVAGLCCRNSGRGWNRSWSRSRNHRCSSWYHRSWCSTLRLRWEWENEIIISQYDNEWVIKDLRSCDAERVLRWDGDPLPGSLRGAAGRSR